MATEEKQHKVTRRVGMARLERVQEKISGAITAATRRLGVEGEDLTLVAGEIRGLVAAADIIAEDLAAPAEAADVEEEGE